MRDSISNKWLRFLTTQVEPPDPRLWEDSGQLALHAESRIERYVHALAEYQLIPDSLVLTQFVFVYPETFEIEITNTSHLVRPDKRELAIEAAELQERYIRNTENSFFRGAIRHNIQHKGSQQHLFLLSKHADWGESLSDNDFVVPVQIPAPGDTGDVDISSIPQSFVAAFGNNGNGRENAATYIKQISASMDRLIGTDGAIVLCVPQIYKSDPSNEDLMKLGGLCGIFVLDKLPDIELLKGMLLVTSRIASSVLEIFSMAYVLVPRYVHHTALSTYGHHIGKLMQESGAMGLHDSNGMLRGVKRRLSLVWGITEAVRPLKNNGKGYPSNWFPENFVIAPDNYEVLSQRIQDICEYYLAGQLNRLSEGMISSKVEWSVNGATHIAELTDLTSNDKELVALPPFVGARSGPLATAALTIGLAELIRNACGYIALHGTKIRLLGNSLPEDLLHIDIHLHKDVSSIVVGISNVSFAEQDIVDSDSIKDVQYIESRSLSIDGNAVVETTLPRVTKGDLVNNTYRWVRGTWTYHFHRPKPHK